MTSAENRKSLIAKNMFSYSINYDWRNAGVFEASNGGGLIRLCLFLRSFCHVIFLKKVSTKSYKLQNFLFLPSLPHPERYLFILLSPESGFFTSILHFYLHSQLAHIPTQSFSVPFQFARTIVGLPERSSHTDASALSFWSLFGVVAVWYKSTKIKTNTKNKEKTKVNGYKSAWNQIYLSTSDRTHIEERVKSQPLRLTQHFFV